MTAQDSARDAASASDDPAESLRRVGHEVTFTYEMHGNLHACRVSLAPAVEIATFLPTDGFFRTGASDSEAYDLVMTRLGFLVKLLVADAEDDAREARSAAAKHLAAERKALSRLAALKGEAA